MKKRTLEVKGMNVVNINVKFLFCCLEMTSLQWINIFFLGLGAPKERAWCVFYVNILNLTLNLQNLLGSTRTKMKVMVIFLSAGNETAIWAGQVPSDTLQWLPQRGLRQQRGLCAHVSLGKQRRAIMPPHMWNQACVWPNTICNDCNNTINDYDSLVISQPLPCLMWLPFLYGIPPPSSSIAVGSMHVASVCIRAAYSAFCLPPNPLLFSHSLCFSFSHASLRSRLCHCYLCVQAS